MRGLTHLIPVDVNAPSTPLHHFWISKILDQWLEIFVLNELKSLLSTACSISLLASSYLSSFDVLRGSIMVSPTVFATMVSFECLQTTDEWAAATLRAQQRLSRSSLETLLLASETEMEIRLRDNLHVVPISFCLTRDGDQPKVFVSHIAKMQKPELTNHSFSQTQIQYIMLYLSRHGDNRWPCTKWHEIP